MEIWTMVDFFDEAPARWRLSISAADDRPQSKYRISFVAFSLPSCMCCLRHRQCKRRMPLQQPFFWLVTKARRRIRGKRQKGGQASQPSELPSNGKQDTAQQERMQHTLHREL
jgi:hypothetical protein